VRADVLTGEGEEMKRERVVVAMSGGVDSSVALALLVERGYDCIGVAMQLWDYSEKEDPGEAAAREGSCCSLDDLLDARRVAESLGAPFYVVNLEEAFSREVVDYFVEGYSKGTTPNPCIKCNEVLKFEFLINRALSLEADFLATGHYARITRTGQRARLLKGADANKDQSYFLFTLTQEQMRRVLFPLGEMTKDEVRAYARRAGIKTHDKQESQEICFVEGPGYREFLSGRIPATPGEIVDADGVVLGAHSGLFKYTVGQRKGLGLAGGPGGASYVLRVDAEANRLIVGPSEGLYSRGLVAGRCKWIDPRDAGRALEGMEGISSKIRYRHAGAGSKVTAGPDGRVRVEFEEPQKAVTPGQAVVFYRGEEVLGGAWIERAL